MIEGYHLCVGGGWGAEQGVGRRLVDALPFDDILPAVERLLAFYLADRSHSGESFAAFVRKRTLEDLRAVAEPPSALDTKPVPPVLKLQSA